MAKATIPASTAVPLLLFLRRFPRLLLFWICLAGGPPRVRAFSLRTFAADCCRNRGTQLSGSISTVARPIVSPLPMIPSPEPRNTHEISIFAGRRSGGSGHSPAAETGQARRPFFRGATTGQQLRSSGAPIEEPINALMPDGGLSPCVIKVVGVGGGGSNAIDRMMETRVEGVEFWAVNTDAQALGRSKAKGASVLNIGMGVTRGLGAGGDPDIGRQAAEESREEIAAMVSGADMVFVTSGMGGGTGSGAAPVVSEIARECGALTVGIVTKPFAFEGKRRMRQATEAIARLKKCVDTVILVSNNKLLEIIPENTPLEKSFAVADDILRQGVVGISEIIVRPGLINVDFADVRSVMHNAGTALMGIGTGTGKTRAEDAAAAAISSPLLDSPIERATGIVFNIIGGRDMSLVEVNRAAKVIYKSVDQDANIIFGALIDDTLSDGSVSITVLATGFKDDEGDTSRPMGDSSRDMPDFLTGR